MQHLVCLTSPPLNIFYGMSRTQVTDVQSLVMQKVIYMLWIYIGAHILIGGRIKQVNSCFVSSNCWWYGATWDPDWLYGTSFFFRIRIIRFHSLYIETSDTRYAFCNISYDWSILSLCVLLFWLNEITVCVDSVLMHICDYVVMLLTYYLIA